MDDNNGNEEKEKNKM